MSSCAGSTPFRAMDPGPGQSGPEMDDCERAPPRDERDFDVKTEFSDRQPPKLIRASPARPIKRGKSCVGRKSAQRQGR